ncbi:hypothetical protein [Flavobacterium stagni]|uniref:Uncharacterized protein n=1 Tax=Flavobacterium stagni TaxID=2506421 RepID=A0A4Q1K4C4_9FLAO|nr:hypothetical protein [Flavobacterium stagni]RXR19462.1 hypothetical protein EQG61_13510 [Flavobacterium stagni]
MKEYFKHDKGYLLINEEAFFLTSSGNWSEIQQLNEKGFYEVRQQAIRSFKVFVWVGLILLISLFISFKSQSYYSFLVGLGLAFSVWRYLITETTIRCKIPMDKMSEVKINEEQNVIVFHFKNARNIEDFELLNEVDPKAILFFKDHFKNLIKGA